VNEYHISGTARYGSETTIYADEGKVVELTENIKDFSVFSTFKRVSVRIKVANKKEETSQYLQFSDLLEKKREQGVLLVKHTDLSTRPTFVIEYPLTNVDGSYFIIHTHTEVVM
jgi:hypothetical protein